MATKEINIKEHGNYLYGSLDGVDFVQSGTLENGQKYGASVKLKFITKVTVVKNVAGIDIPTQKAISQIIKIPTTDDKLVELVHKYNDFIGKELLINYGTADNNTFSISATAEIKVIG